MRQQLTIVAQLPAAHAITGGDTVAQCFGFGKARAIKCLKSGNCLRKLGEISVNINDVITEATEFMVVTVAKNEKVCDIRIDIWSTTIWRQSLTAAPELKSLPPTTEAFEMNVRRAHI